MVFMTATLPLALEWESEMNYEAEDRLGANGLVSQVLGQMDSHGITDAHGRDAGVRQVLYAAADILVAAGRSGQTLPAGEDLVRESLARAEWTPKKWARVTAATRALVEEVIRRMAAIQAAEDNPDGYDDNSAGDGASGKGEDGKADSETPARQSRGRKSQSDDQD